MGISWRKKISNVDAKHLRIFTRFHFHFNIAQFASLGKSTLRHFIKPEEKIFRFLITSKHMLNSQRKQYHFRFSCLENFAINFFLLLSRFFLFRFSFFMLFGANQDFSQYFFWKERIFCRLFLWLHVSVVTGIFPLNLQHKSDWQKIIQRKKALSENIPQIFINFIDILIYILKYTEINQKRKT
jgi:hypothetical protein